MTYSSGTLIQATDYNNLAWGGTQGTYTASPTNIAYVMGVGSGAIGYGQAITAINTVAAAGSVTAVQWSGMLTLLNQATAHQSGTAAITSNYTTGQKITYFANVATAVTTINTNAALYSAQGATTTGANFDATISTTTGITTATQYGLRTVTFASANAARYFFNAGGQLNYYVSTPTGAGSAAQNSLIALINGLGGWGQKNTSSTGRTGSGITLNVNSTTFGYRNNVLNSGTTVVQVTDTAAAYTADVGYIQVYTNSSDTTNGSNGLNVIFFTLFNVADHILDDTISLTHRTRVDIVYPESTYLTTNSWGTPTIT